MIPGRYDLTVYQGDDRVFTFRLRTTNPDGSVGPYADLTGHVGLCQIRENPESAVILATLTVALLDQGDSDTLGMLTATLSDADSDGLPVTVEGSEHAWDLQTTEAGFVQTWIYGTVTVLAEVSRP